MGQKSDSVDQTLKKKKISSLYLIQACYLDAFSFFFNHSSHLTMHVVPSLLQNSIYKKSLMRIYEHILIQTHQVAERRQKSILY